VADVSAVPGALWFDWFDVMSSDALLYGDSSTRWRHLLTKRHVPHSLAAFFILQDEQHQPRK